jgi:hypothetical protein
MTERWSRAFRFSGDRVRIPRMHHTHQALRRPRPRIWARGVIEYWSPGVLRQDGIASRDCGVQDALEAIDDFEA